MVTYSIFFKVEQLTVCESNLKIEPWISLFLWITTKSFSSLIWVYAIMYILWPRKITFTKNQPSDDSSSDELVDSYRDDDEIEGRDSLDHRIGQSYRSSAASPKKKGSFFKSFGSDANRTYAPIGMYMTTTGLLPPRSLSGETSHKSSEEDIIL
jgi:hypothetical protein